MKYSGFWIRFCAALIDGIILNIFGLIAGFIVGLIVGIVMGSSETAQGFAAILGFGVGTIIGWLYCAKMESSDKQATLGKQALGIKVTMLDGKPISFAQATVRYFAKYLSTLIFLIGYIMAAFTNKKQALHDMLAKTVVIKG